MGESGSWLVGVTVMVFDQLVASLNAIDRETKVAKDEVKADDERDVELDCNLLEVLDQ